MYLLLDFLHQTTEHSENKIITHIENEVGPVVLQSSVQETFSSKEFQRIMTESKHGICFVSSAFLQKT